MNKVIILGRLGGNPELSYTPTGAACCTFSVATSERGKDQDKTEWHRIVVWGKLAELCSQYLKKGSLVFTEGGLQTRKWEDKDGSTRYTTEIIAKEVKFLDKFPGHESGQAQD
nr:single-stranded DNA-binding protein [Bacteriovorax sp. HI3]